MPVSRIISAQIRGEPFAWNNSFSPLSLYSIFSLGRKWNCHYLICIHEWTWFCCICKFDLIMTHMNKMRARPPSPPPLLGVGIGDQRFHFECVTRCSQYFGLADSWLAQREGSRIAPLLITAMRTCKTAAADCCIHGQSHDWAQRWLIGDWLLMQSLPNKSFFPPLTFFKSCFARWCSSNLNLRQLSFDVSSSAKAAFAGRVENFFAF